MCFVSCLHAVSQIRHLWSRTFRRATSTLVPAALDTLATHTKFRLEPSQVYHMMEDNARPFWIILWDLAAKHKLVREHRIVVRSVEVVCEFLRNMEDKQLTVTDLEFLRSSSGAECLRNLFSEFLSSPSRARLGSFNANRLDGLYLSIVTEAAMILDNLRRQYDMLQVIQQFCDSLCSLAVLDKGDWDKFQRLSQGFTDAKLKTKTQAEVTSPDFWGQLTVFFEKEKLSVVADLEKVSFSRSLRGVIASLKDDLVRDGPLTVEQFIFESFPVALQQWVRLSSPFYDAAMYPSLSLADVLDTFFGCVLEPRFPHDQVVEQVRKEFGILNTFLGRESVKGALDDVLCAFELNNFVVKSGQLESVQRIFNLRDESLVDNIRMICSSAKDRNIALQRIVLAITDLKRNSEKITKESWELIAQLAKAGDFIKFLREIVNEDVRNLIDAVEEFSGDQFAANNESVSDLISLHTFLRPYLLEGLSAKYDVGEFALLLQDRAMAQIGSKKSLADIVQCCCGSVPALRRLYLGLSNRGDVTKDVVRMAVSEGQYCFTLAQDEVALILTICVGEKKTEYDLTRLRDFKSRSLLYLHSATKQEEGEGRGQRSMFELFIQRLSQAEAARDALEAIYVGGHLDPAYRNISVKVSNADDMEAFASVHQETLAMWNLQLRDARARHPSLLFFSGRQLQVISAGFESTERPVPAKSSFARFLLFACPKIELSTVPVVPMRGTAAEQLEALGACLDALFAAQLAPTPELFLASASNANVLHRVQPGQVFVGVTPSLTDCLHVAMTLFINDGLRPCANQLLMCRNTTSRDELDVFLARCLQGTKLHILLTPNLLPVHLQYQLIDTIRASISKQFLLGLVVPRESQSQLLGQFYNDVQFTTVSKDLFKKTMQESSILQTHCVTSELPGQGKTELIRSLALNAGKSLLSVTLCGTLDRRHVVDQLRRLPLDANVALHLNITEVDNPWEINALVLELCVLLCVSDDRGYIHMPKGMLLFLEVANTLLNELSESLPVCTAFRDPSLHLRWDFKAFIASSILTSSVQVCCHYLNALQNRSVANTDLIFIGPHRNVAPLSSERCRALLEAYFPLTQTPDCSFAILNVFLKTFEQQLRKFTGSTFFRVETLASMFSSKDAAQSIRMNLVTALFKVAAEFAAPSVEACRTSQRAYLRSSPGRLMAERKYLSWTESEHLLVVFHELDRQTITPLYRHPRNLPKDVVELFQTQSPGQRWIPKDYAVLSSKELYTILLHICRRTDRDNTLPVGYALTADNMLKMVLIFLRIQAGVPCVIMGHTGCGKTSVIRFLASEYVCDVHFRCLPIHAGVSAEEIIQFVSEVDQLAAEHGRAWGFLDEINTCQHLGLIADLICHRQLLGRKLHAGCTLLAACNPYELRGKHGPEAGLTVKTKRVDDLALLTYRVHPLPEVCCPAAKDLCTQVLIILGVRLLDIVFYSFGIGLCGSV